MFSLGDFDGISSFSPTYDVLGADADGLFIRGRDSSWQDGMVYLDATIAGSGDPSAVQRVVDEGSSNSINMYYIVEQTSEPGEVIIHVGQMGLSIIN